MRIIIKIAKAELRNLFFSPVAWVIIVAFFVLCGIQFGDALVALASQQQFSQENMKEWTGFNASLTVALFQGAYKYLLDNLFLFMPLITMGVISREVNAGTIRLLNSSPVRNRDIVLGKYLGLVIYMAVLMLPVSLLMITGYFSIVHAEPAVFMSALLGIFLLSCTYASIGLFVSALTNYQVVAALFTFLLFILLGNMSVFWQQHDFYRDLSWFLNLSGRIEALLGGLITTKDLAYFLFIIALFVGFTWLKLHNRMESGKWYRFFARYVLLLVLVVMTGYVSSRPSLIAYRDVTRGKVNTIHPVVQEVMKELGDDPLDVTLYANIMDNYSATGFPASRNQYLWGMWGKYIRFHPNTRFHYVYYYDLMEGDTNFAKIYPNKTLDQVAKRFISLNGLPKSIVKTPAEIRKMIDLSGEGKRLVMQLEYKGRKTFLRTYEDLQIWPDQQQVAGAISMLTRNNIPTIIFSSGHYERSPYKIGEREYSIHTLQKKSRMALMNLGVKVDTINLAAADIPGDALLVVADPKSALSIIEQEKIRRHIDNGGNLIVYAEPGKQDLLNPVLRSIGVVLEDGIIVSPNENEMPQITMHYLTDTAKFLGDEEVLWAMRYKKDTIGVKYSGALSMHYEEANGFRIEPLSGLSDTMNVWRERGYFVADSAAPVYSAAEGDIKEAQLVSAIQLWRPFRSKEQRIIVMGDADFMSGIRGAGGALGNAAYSWLMKNAYPFYANYPPPTDRLLTIKRKTSKSIRFVFVYLLPSMAAITGIILLVRRKRK